MSALPASRRPAAVNPWRSIEVTSSSTMRGRTPSLAPRVCRSRRSSSRPTVCTIRSDSGVATVGRHGLSTSTEPGNRFSTAATSA